VKDRLVAGGVEREEVGTAIGRDAMVEEQGRAFRAAVIGTGRTKARREAGAQPASAVFFSYAKDARREELVAPVGAETDVIRLAPLCVCAGEFGSLSRLHGRSCASARNAAGLPPGARMGRIPPRAVHLAIRPQETSHRAKTYAHPCRTTR
jgi:hypothetical protein